MLTYIAVIKIHQWALLPQDDETLEELVRMGRRDAKRWAEERGGRGGDVARADVDDAVAA